MSVRVAGRRDVRDDPGLARTELTNQRGPYVGSPRCTPLRRFASDRRLNALLLELAAGFGRQHWWPAETPFEVIVGAVLTQNTSWTNVERALATLKARVRLTPARLLALPADELAESIRSSGYFRAKAKKLHAISTWYLDEGGLTNLRRAPLRPLRARLLDVFGVGPETADSILCYAAGRRTAVVDTYTRRILGRHGLIDPDVPYEKMREWLMERLLRSRLIYEEFHALIVRAGNEACKPTPRCEACFATTPALHSP